jgi:hypothetical protein
MSDTPRTDAAEYESQDEPAAKLGAVDVEFARQLERELDRACKMYRKLDIHALDLVDRIIRLEAAGDVVEKKLGCGCGCYGLCKDCQRASENWHKAKEAKP